MKAIVTGATGFIGVALCRELIQNGHQVIAVIRPNSAKVKKLENLKQELKCNNEVFKIIELSLDKLKSLNEKNIHADVFYHLAWNGPAGQQRNDFNIQYSNIEYTANAVCVAKACGCKKIIVTGSQAEYGVVKDIANEDNTVTKPFMMYGAAKLSSYHMANILSEQLGITLVWPRIYSVYGVGENSGTLVNYVIESLKNNEVPQLSPCENMWNFMYITDCVCALRLLAEKEQTEGIYNIASQDTRILKEFVKQIRDLISPDAKLNFNARISDEKRTFWLEPDCSKLLNLGFECKVSFEQGIKMKDKE